MIYNEFITNLYKYKNKKYNTIELSHGISSKALSIGKNLNNMANYGYYNKIDNYYGPGKSRYFYSKEEWDAYQKEKNAMYQKAKDDVRKHNEEKIQNELNKYKNVQQAQNARQQEEKKGTYAERERQIKQINNKLDKSYDIYKDFLEIMGKAGGNATSWITSTLQKNLPEGYKVDSDGDITVDLAKAYPELQKRKKEIDTKEARLDFGVDDPKNESIKNYKERKTDIEYERSKLLEEFNEKYYSDIMKAMNHLIDDNNEQSAIKIRNALWQAANSKDFKSLKGKIMNELFSGINYYSFVRPNSSNTETWDNSKNIKSFDNNTTLYEDILKEDILKEDILKEDVIKEKKR